ncbi:MAG: M23 family metallopeptidase [Candidatus Moranbacteria bacterium]|nr:M23 family metallopeptidase [Candidatus Moranbacteria bacterium]NTW75709.1 M23 family metallopeptidase [Candidatus Moranbacteria bacterium]
MTGRLFLTILVLIAVSSVGTFLLRTRFISETELPEPEIAESHDSESAEESGTEGRPSVVPAGYAEPLPRATERVTKKPFGVYIMPSDSPVQLERFAGYHTGTDFEVFPDEEDADVVVLAICTGELLSKRTASGYGGVLVQSCEYEGDPITVLYGHMRLSSVEDAVGDEVVAGELLGVLGAGYSADTDGERKHLHLGIHRGTDVNILGYVASERELSGWIDPCVLLCPEP